VEQRALEWKTSAVAVESSWAVEFDVDGRSRRERVRRSMRMRRTVSKVQGSEGVVGQEENC